MDKPQFENVHDAYLAFEKSDAIVELFKQQVSEGCYPTGKYYDEELRLFRFPENINRHAKIAAYAMAFMAEDVRQRTGKCPMTEAIKDLMSDDHFKAVERVDAQGRHLISRQPRLTLIDGGKV